MKPHKTTVEQELWMVNPRTLTDMAHLPLRGRCELIKSRFGFDKFSANLLRRIYLRHGVRYLKAAFSYQRKEVQHREICDKQVAVSRDLAEMMMLGKRVIYVDETSFHQWMVPARNWVRADMNLKMPSTRGKSVTIIGGISEQGGMEHYKIVKGSNDATTFKAFIDELAAKVTGDAVIAMDNYSVHRAGIVKEAFDDRITQLFLPPYSCAMNPIERLWHIVKLRWRRVVLQHPDGFTEDEMEEEIRKVINDISQRQVRAISRSHVQFMVRSLRGHMV